MKVSHRLQIECRCPSDKGGDLYEAEITVERVLPVERILKLSKRAKKKTMYQEDLAVWLARRLNAKVKLTGSHYGVRTVVEA